VQTTFGVRQGVPDAEGLLGFDDLPPLREGEGLVDSVTFFAAIVFAAGEGVVFGRHALREIEFATDSLGGIGCGAVETVVRRFPL
jgi:hypothetical protein